MRAYALATVAMAALALVFAIASFPDTITGAASYRYDGEERSTYAYTLNDWVRGFFQVESIVFPPGSCTSVVEEIYGNMAFKPLSATEDLSTHGRERTSSVMFGFEGDAIGALEMIYGKNLINMDGIDSSLNLIGEAPVRLPKLTRVANVELSLYGVSRDKLYVTEGALVLPTLQCRFVVEDGRAVCDCNRIERTYDYAAKKVGVGIYNNVRD